MLKNTLTQMVQDELAEARNNTVNAEELQIITNCAENIISEINSSSASENSELDLEDIASIERKMHLLAGDSDIPFERSLYLNIAMLISREA